LGQEGFEVEYANSGEDGLKKINEQDYQIVFLDESMPRMTGGQAFKKIRKFSRVPVAFISGFITPEKKRQVMAMGAVSCLEKPLDLARVKSLIHTVAQRNFQN